MDLCKQAQLLWHDYILLRTPEALGRAMAQLADDCVIIGTGKHEFYLSRAGMEQALARELTTTAAKTFTIVDEWYQALPLDAQTVLVYGGVWVRDAELGRPALVDMDSRFSLLYCLQDGAWKVRHVHQSMPYREQAPGEYYPRTLTEQVRMARQEADRMTRLARTDPVTGLYNHRAFFEEAERLLAQGPVCFMVLDLDDFKQINDTCGHMKGDEVLACTGRVLRAATRSVDVVGRIGGDEFAVLCPRVEKEGTALSIARRILRQVNAQAGAPAGCTVRLSIGIALSAPGLDARALFDRADRALYKVKAAGKNDCRLYDPSLEPASV